MYSEIINKINGATLKVLGVKKINFLSELVKYDGLYIARQAY